MLTTVQIATTDKHGKPASFYFGSAPSVKAALKIIDGNAPAPVNPHVRRRIETEQGGELRIGQLDAVIAVCA